jgi:hypothetical protein
MGTVSSECACQEGILGFCQPQNPADEHATTVVAQPPPVYPGAVSTAAVVPPPYQPQQTCQEQANIEGYAMDDASMSYGNEGVFDAPPPSGGPPPEPSAAPERAAPAPAPVHRQEGNVTVDGILSDLERSEEFVYGNVFASFPGGQNGSVTLDTSALRDFVCTNTAITMDDLDMELLKKTPDPEHGMSLHDFLELLREFSVGDGDCLEQFLGMSADGETLASEECRSGLLMFATQKLHANFGDERWDRVFNVVMLDAGTKVGMEQWMKYCKHTARLVRILQYSQL